MGKKIDLNSGVILKKNKNYNSVQEAQMFYEKQRMSQLSTILFPVDEYPDGFKELVISLMKFQNPVQMNVWHNKNVKIKDEKGNTQSTTWENLCYFNRPFVCAEMYQCIEILKRVTPDEIDQTQVKFVHIFRDEVIKKNGNKITSSDFNDIVVLSFFNEIYYPKIEKIVLHIQTVLDEIEEQVCKPIRDKINADLKVMMQMSVGENVEFIKGKERKM